MTNCSSSKLPPLFGLALGVVLACSGTEHPPPIGDGGRPVQGPPVIVEFGGTTSTGGTPGGAASANGGSLDAFAGNSGDTSLGGTSMPIAGDAPSAGSAGSGSAGTPISFSGSFSTGGM